MSGVCDVSTIDPYIMFRELTRPNAAYVLVFVPEQTPATFL